MPAYLVDEEDGRGNNEFEIHALHGESFASTTIGKVSAAAGEVVNNNLNNEMMVRVAYNDGVVSGGRELSDLREFTSLTLSPAPVPTPFNPIGYGLPLTIDIRHIYTGRLRAKSNFFGGNHGAIAVFSGVKEYSSIGASTRALNFIKKSFSSKQHISAGPAFDIGTPIVAYFPSMLSSSLTLTVEMAVDDFDDVLMEALANVFKAASQIPILLPVAGYLIAAQSIIKIGSEIGNRLLDGQPDFSISEVIPFELPGQLPAQARTIILSESNLLEATHVYDPKWGLIHRDTKKPYDLDEPYVVIGLDGTNRNDELKDFVPSAVGADILKRFLNIKENQGVPLASLTESLQLASDLRFMREAKRIKRQIEALATEDPSRAKVEAKYNALKNSIIDSDIRSVV